VIDKLWPSRSYASWADADRVRGKAAADAEIRQPPPPPIEGATYDDDPYDWQRDRQEDRDRDWESREQGY
jgi:hypothetical protein